MLTLMTSLVAVTLVPSLAPYYGPWWVLLFIVADLLLVLQVALDYKVPLYLALSWFFSLLLAYAISTGLSLLVTGILPFTLGAFLYWSYLDLGQNHWMTRFLEALFMASLFGFIWKLVKDYFGIDGPIFATKVYAHGKKKNKGKGKSKASAPNQGTTQAEPSASSNSSVSENADTIPLTRAASAPPWGFGNDTWPFPYHDYPETDRERDSALQSYEHGFMKDLDSLDLGLLADPTLQVTRNLRHDPITPGTRNPMDPPRGFRQAELFEDLHETSGIPTTQATKSHDPTHLHTGSSVLWRSLHSGIGFDRGTKLTPEQAIAGLKEVIKSTYDDQIVTSPLSKGSKTSVKDLPTPAQYFIQFGLIMEQLYLMSRAGMSPADQLRILEELFKLLSQIERGMAVPTSSSDPNLERLIILRRKVERLYRLVKLLEHEYFDFTSLLDKKDRSDNDDSDDGE